MAVFHASQWLTASSTRVSVLGLRVVRGQGSEKGPLSPSVFFFTIFISEQLKDVAGVNKYNRCKSVIHWGLFFVSTRIYWACNKWYTSRGWNSPPPLQQSETSQKSEVSEEQQIHDFCAVPAHSWKRAQTWGADADGGLWSIEGVFAPLFGLSGSSTVRGLCSRLHQTGFKCWLNANGMFLHMRAQSCACIMCVCLSLFYSTFLLFAFVHGWKIT